MVKVKFSKLLTVQLEASEGTTAVALVLLYWTRPWNTFAKYPSVTKKPTAGSRESYPAVGDSSISWLVLLGLRVYVEPEELVTEVVEVVVVCWDEVVLWVVDVELLIVV
jgi:hypothetical protein